MKLCSYEKRWNTDAEDDQEDRGRFVVYQKRNRESEEGEVGRQGEEE